MKSFKEHDQVEVDANSIVNKLKKFPVTKEQIDSTLNFLGIVKNIAVNNIATKKIIELWKKTKSDYEQAYKESGRDLEHDKKVTWVAGLVVCAVIAGVATNNIIDTVKAKGEIDYKKVHDIMDAVDKFMRTWGGRQ